MPHDPEALRGIWSWFVILGVALVVLGTVALGSVVIASMATAVVIGVVLFAGGLAEILGASWCRGWSGFFFHLLSGVLSVVIGIMFVQAPADALLGLTLLVAFYLMVEGLFKVVSAANCRFSMWGWPMMSGIIDVILGIMIWRRWPGSAYWVIGMFVGINLLFRGFTWIGLGMALRTMPRPALAMAAP